MRQPMGGDLPAAANDHDLPAGTGLPARIGLVALLACAVS